MGAPKAVPKKNSRRHIRFSPDPGTIAGISLKPDIEFQLEHSAIILNESFQGCCLVIPANRDLAVGAIIWVKIGKIDPCKAEIRWLEQLDPEVFKVGLRYLD